MISKNGILFVVGAVILSATFILSNRDVATAQGKAELGAGPRYTVVETQGHNLLVTDNSKNVVYFYTTEKDAPVGSDLKLRASVDLTQVGSEAIKISKAAK